MGRALLLVASWVKEEETRMGMNDIILMGTSSNNFAHGQSEVIPRFSPRSSASVALDAVTFFSM